MLSRGRASASRGSCPCAQHEVVLLHVNRHMCSGRPVVADCMRTNWSGVCVPSPSGRLALGYRSPAFLMISTIRGFEVAQHVAGICRACRAAEPPLARLTERSARRWRSGRPFLFKRFVGFAPAEDGNVDHGFAFQELPHRSWRIDLRYSDSLRAVGPAVSGGNLRLPFSASNFNTRPPSSPRPIRGTAARR